MQKVLLMIFSTIVLSHATHGASNKELGKELDLKSGSQTEDFKPVDSDYEFDLTPMEKPMRSDMEYNKPAYMTSEYSLSPHIGVGYSNKNKNAYSLGIQYINFRNPHRLEFSFELYNKGAAAINASRKWYLMNMGKYQGHLKAGLGFYLNPSQGIATIVDVKNLGINLQIGFEKTLKPPVSLRFDIDAFIGQRETLFLVNTGYSWAW